MRKQIQQNFTHPQKVKLLYKTILKLHRGLPTELRALGDQYTKDEFRRHKNVEPQLVKTFMVEWTDYAVRLTEQLGLRGPLNAKPVGIPLFESELNKFTDEQIQQLYELFKEASGQNESKE